MKTVKVLTEARILLASADRWTQFVLARNINGNPVSSRDPRAIRWCLIGAIMKIADGDYLLLQSAFDAIKRCWNLEPAYFNDHNTHDDVLCLLDTTISRLRSNTP